MSAGKLNITIEQGAKFDKTFTYETAAGVAIDLTGRTGRMDIRDVKGGTMLFELRETPAPGQGTITTGGVLGTVRLEIGADLTAAITTWTTGFYDLELELTSTPTDVIRLIEGKVKANIITGHHPFNKF